MSNLAEKLLAALYAQNPIEMALLKNRLHCTKEIILETAAQLQAAGVANFVYENAKLHLLLPLPLLNPVFFQETFPQQKIVILPVTDSTNAVLKRKSHCTNGEVCLTEYQSMGRGRHNRTWLSPFAGQLIMSMYWCYPHRISLLQGLSIRLGLAAVKALHQETFTDIRLKWPNDLYLYGRKLGGILPEIVSRGQNTGIVAGIGINLTCSPQTEQATANLSECGKKICRHTITAAVIRAWSQLFSGNGINQNIEPSVWAKYDIYLHQEMVLTAPAFQVRGINRGINESGQLLLEHEGKIHSYNIGELQLRPSPLI